MFDGILKSIRAKSRAEWQAHLHGKVSFLRDYVRENGERAAVLGFLLGVFLVIFYKLALVLVCLAVVGYQLLLIMSDSGRAE
jgi:hypothetical protein